MNKNENFCKGSCVSKVIAEIKVDARVEQQKKFTGFSRMSVTWNYYLLLLVPWSVMTNSLCFGCFAAG